jgi:ABC-type multidrug transport system fused ATPase/permease subunit
MSDESGRKRDKSLRNFGRATRFLWPYRRTVIISIGCALFVGVAFTGGITAMLPIMRVLLNNQTVAEWANGQIAENRLGVQLSDEAAEVRILRVHEGSPAERAGLLPSDVVVPETHTGLERRDRLKHLADPAVTTADIAGKPVMLNAAPSYYNFGGRVAARFPERPLYAIAMAFGIIAVITCVGNVVRFFQEYLSDRAAIMAVRDIRTNLYDHILHVPMSFFGQRGTSDVTSRLVQDAAGLQEGFRLLLGPSIQEPIKIVFALGLAIFLSWKLTLFIFLFGPIMFLIIKKFGKKMRRASRTAMVQSASMLGQIEGTLIGIRVVKGANAERFERRRYAGIMDGLTQEQLRMSRIEAMSSPAIETLSLFVIGGIVLFASYMVLELHSLEKTTFFLVMICLGGIGESLRRTSKVNNVLQRSNAAATRIFETIDLPSEKLRTEEEKALPRARLAPIAKEVRFENIGFTYPGTTAPALNDVSLTVPKGTSVAVVGRNGSGKTTLLALLPRFYDPTLGRVTIDGVDIRNVTRKSLRDQISLVTQDSVLFPGTVAENIAYGHPLAHLLRSTNPRHIASTVGLRKEIEEAAKRAFAHEFITDRGGYDHMLDGLGGGLSGGQKQRINIARAILRRAPILILDEATSQVDAESEQLIQQAIESLMHERTTFVIAHRFSTIISADTIVVMDRGRIVGQGKHDELLESCKTYAQLYERQLFGGGASA